MIPEAESKDAPLLFNCSMNAYKNGRNSLDLFIF